MKTAFYLIAFLVPCLPLRASGPSGLTPADPAKTVQAFYDYYLKHNGHCDVRTVKAAKQFFTPQLYKALLAEFGKPVPEGDAPDIDWDVFTDAQDLPKAVEIKKTAIGKNIAKVEAIILWSSKNENETITVALSQSDHEWKINDFYYPAKRITLTALLGHGS